MQRGKDAKNIFAKVIMDKREMQAYIKENNPLKGFKGASFGFAKPL